MNIIFWIIIIAILVFIWFCLSFSFKSIGKIGLKLFNDAKKEIESDDLKKTQELGDDVSNEW